MKKISVEIEDEIYAYLENYSKQTGKSIEDLAAEVVTGSLSVLDYNRAAQEMEKEHNLWKRERGFPIYGEAATIPHPLCR